MENKKVINFDIFKKFLSELSAMSQDKPHAEQVVPIIDRMKELTDLLADYSHLTSEEDRKEAEKRILNYQKLNQKSIDELFAQFGTTLEETQNRLADPSQLTQQDQEKMRHLQAIMNAAVNQ